MKLKSSDNWMLDLIIIVKIQMKLSIFFILLALTPMILSLSAKNKCILDKLIADLKLNSLQQSGKNLDENDSVIKILNSKGNLNQEAIVQEIIVNYDQLPRSLWEDLKNCATNLEVPLKRCETVHGKGNCEKRDEFTVQVKCPDGFENDDYTRCVRKCKDDDEIIDFNCNSKETFFLEEDILYSSKEECETKTGKNCVTSSFDENLFTKGCPITYRQVAFICVPLCFNEFNKETLDILRKTKGYCVKDYLELSLPFFDI